MRRKSDKMSPANPRPDYSLQGLIETAAHANPLEQFRRWLDEAVDARLHEPLAMTLATTSLEGKPAARMVLLRGFDERGFAFYSNRASRKGRELEASPHAALVFYWAELDRQVRIDGKVEWTSDAESDAYFQSRPRGHQLSAWASSQSEIIAGRAFLEREMAELTARYEGKEIPRPPHWGGYRIVPNTIEFWQGRPNRLHDRLLYSREANGTWRRQRLSP
jgi:pyridoxamine 5'-phosphate oxidase